MKNIIGNLSTYSAAILLFIFGFIYLLKSSFMPYHHEAVNTNWNEIEPSFRILILALMRAASGGFITMAIAITFLQYQFQKNPSTGWIPNLILVLGTVFMFCSLYAIILVSLNTPGRPPIFADMAGEVLIIIGFIFNRKFYHAQGT
jgi:hypothetical protein